MSGPDDIIEEFFPPDPDPAPEPPLGVGIHLNISHDRYLGDPCERPSLNASVAKEIATDTPLHAWHAHPRLGGDAPAKFGSNLDRGSIIHKLILGRGADFATVNATDWKKGWAQAKRKEIRGAGLIPVLAGDMDDYVVEAEIYKKKLRDGWGITFDGVQTEVTAVWEEAGVLCRARFDAWRPDPGELVIDDLKTIPRANVRAVQRACHNFGYDIAGEHYVKAAEHLVPDTDGRWTMRFIFLEGAPAFEPLVIVFAGSMAEAGRQRRRRAFDLWARCIGAGVHRDVWPGRPRTILRLEAQAWALKDDDEAAFASFENEPPPF